MMERFIARRRVSILLAAVLLAAPAFASNSAAPCDSPELCPCWEVANTSVPSQQSDTQGMGQNTGQMTMPMPTMNMAPPARFIAEILAHSTAGTTAEPNSTPHDMLMAQKGGWTFMFHCVGFLY